MLTLETPGTVGLDVFPVYDAVTDGVSGGDCENIVYEIRLFANGLIDYRTIPMHGFCANIFVSYLWDIRLFDVRPGV